jgi:hypothetical protein
MAVMLTIENDVPVRVADEHRGSLIDVQFGITWSIEILNTLT